MTTIRHVVAIAVVAAFIATSCTSSSSDETTTENTQVADTGPEAGAEAPATTLATPVELTATDTGVTAETIKIAVVFPDLSVVSRDSGDVEAKYRVAVDAVNDAGGINGRQIEMLFALYQPVGDVEADALCISNVEDEEVFAVLGVLLRENSLCYTDGGAVTINTLATTSELYARAQAPLIGVDAVSERLVEENIDTLIEAGHLNPGSRIAVHGLASKADLHNTYVAVLADRGVEVVTDTMRTIDDDVVEGAAEVAVFAERWIADGAEATLGSAPESATDLVGAYDENGIELPMLLPENSHIEPSFIGDTFGYSLDPLRFAVVLVRDTDSASQYADNTAGAADCVDRFEAASGETVSIDESDDGSDNLEPTIAACQAVDIFSAVAEAAGVELTTESFAAAAEGFGAIEVTAVIEGSLGPGKFDISDTPAQIAGYDPSAMQFVVS